MSNDTAKEQIFNIQKNIFTYFTDTNQSYSNFFYDSIKTNVNSSRWHFCKNKVEETHFDHKHMSLNGEKFYKEVLNIFVLP